MPTINTKKSALTIPFVDGTLTYNNIPLDIFATNSSGVVERVSKIRIQPKKINNENIKINIGKLLVEDTDFSVSTNATNNGVNITLFQNIPNATHLRVKRYTNPSFTNNYSVNNQNGTSLKVSLDEDITRSGNVLQENEQAIEELQDAQNGYTEELDKRKVYTVHGRGGDIVAQKGDYTAEQIAFTPNQNSQITADNIGDALRQAVIIASDKTSGNIAEACRVATRTNIDLLNVSAVDGIALNINDRVFVKHQTITGQNGIYVYSAINTLTRTIDASTLFKLKGLQASIKEGTSAGKGFYCTVTNTQGVLNVEPVLVEEAVSYLRDNQVLNNNLATAPQKTFKGNDLNTTATPQDIPQSNAFNKPFGSDTGKIKENGIASVGTSDGIAREDHIHPHDTTKANQTDLDDLNAYTVQGLNAILTDLSTKQEVLPIGGNDQIVGYRDGNIEAVDIYALRRALDNDRTNNTSDVDKPISNAQAEEFAKTYSVRGNLGSFLVGTDPNLNSLINLRSGMYIISQNDISRIVNKPVGVSTSLNAFFYIDRIINNKDDINSTAYVKQTYIEQVEYIDQNLPSNPIKKKINTYYRIYNVVVEGIITTPVWTEWRRALDSDDRAEIIHLISEITTGGASSLYITGSQLTTALNTKENALPNGNVNQFLNGDKEWTDATTSNIIESTNQYFTQARVRATPLTGYTPTSNTTTASSTVLEALENKADRFNPDFTGGNITLTNNATNSPVVNVVSIVNHITASPDTILVGFRVYQNINTAYHDIIYALFTNGIHYQTVIHNATLPGTPTAPTPTANDNSTQIATTEFVQTALNSIQLKINAVGLRAYMTGKIFNAPNLPAHYTLPYIQQQAFNVLRLKYGGSLNQTIINTAVSNAWLQLTPDLSTILVIDTRYDWSMGTWEIDNTLRNAVLDALALEIATYIYSIYPNHS